MTDDRRDGTDPEEPVDETPSEGGLKEGVIGHEATFSLSEEEFVTRTRSVTRGRVVIRKQVETVPYEVPVDLRRDDVEIERVAMDADIDEHPGVRQEGDTTIVPVVVEVLVVEKRLRLVEEVRITRRQVVDQEIVRDELRREVVDVEEEFDDSGEPRRG